VSKVNLMRSLAPLLSVSLCLAFLYGCVATPANKQVEVESCEGGVCPLPQELIEPQQLQSSWVLEDMQGAELDIDAALASGRRVAFVFWQTWCASCRAEFPALNAAAKKYQGKIDYVGVISGPNDMVDDAEVDAVVKQFKLTYPQVRDRDLVLTRRYEVTGTPTIVIVGKDEETLYLAHHAPEDWGAYSQ